MSSVYFYEMYIKHGHTVASGSGKVKLRGNAAFSLKASRGRQLWLRRESWLCGSVWKMTELLASSVPSVKALLMDFWCQLLVSCLVKYSVV